MEEDFERAKEIIDQYNDQNDSDEIISFLSDAVPAIRAYALEILYRMNVDEAKKHAERMKDDISDDVRKIAEKILLEERLEKTGQIILTYSNPFTDFIEKETLDKARKIADTLIGSPDKRPTEKAIQILEEGLAHGEEDLKIKILEAVDKRAPHAGQEELAKYIETFVKCMRGEKDNEAKNKTGVVLIKLQKIEQQKQTVEQKTRDNLDNCVEKFVEPSPTLKVTVKPPQK